VGVVRGKVWVFRQYYCGKHQFAYKSFGYDDSSKVSLSTMLGVGWFGQDRLAINALFVKMHRAG